MLGWHAVTLFWMARGVQPIEDDTTLPRGSKGGRESIGRSLEMVGPTLNLFAFLDTTRSGRADIF